MVFQLGRELFSLVLPKEIKDIGKTFWIRDKF